MKVATTGLASTCTYNRCLSESIIHLTPKSAKIKSSEKEFQRFDCLGDCQLRYDRDCFSWCFGTNLERCQHAAGWNLLSCQLTKSRLWWIMAAAVFSVFPPRSRMNEEFQRWCKNNNSIFFTEWKQVWLNLKKSEALLLLLHSRVTDMHQKTRRL